MLVRAYAHQILGFTINESPSADRRYPVDRDLFLKKSSPLHIYYVQINIVMTIDCRSWRKIRPDPGIVTQHGPHLRSGLFSRAEGDRPGAMGAAFRRRTASRHSRADLPDEYRADRDCLLERGSRYLCLDQQANFVLKPFCYLLQDRGSYVE
jgi:hypothetical protein